MPSWWSKKTSETTTIAPVHHREGRPGSEAAATALLGTRVGLVQTNERIPPGRGAPASTASVHGGRCCATLPRLNSRQLVTVVEALYPSADAVDPDEKQRYKRFNVHMQRKGGNPGNKAEYFSRAHIRGVHWRGEQRIKLIKTHDGSAVKVDAAGASTR